MDSSITSMDIDNNIIDNTDNIREMINAEKKNRKTKNRTLTSIVRELVLSKLYN